MNQRLSSYFNTNHTINELRTESNSRNSNTNDMNSHTSGLMSTKTYDYILKFLLVGDSDVGKDEILNNLDEDNSCIEPSFCRSPGVAYKATNILLDGKRIRLQVWDTSGQGRFSTIFRSYSRGAQGVILVYDITNKWSFAGLNRWLIEVEEVFDSLLIILFVSNLCIYL